MFSKIDFLSSQLKTESLKNKNQKTMEKTTFMEIKEHPILHISRAHCVIGKTDHQLIDIV